MEDILTCYKSKVVSGDQIVHCMIILFLLMGISILINRSFADHLPTYKDHGKSFLFFCRRSRFSHRPHKTLLYRALARERSQPPPPSPLCARLGTSSWHQIWTLSVGIKTGWWETDRGGVVVAQTLDVWRNKTIALTVPGANESTYIFFVLSRLPAASLKVAVKHWINALFSGRFMQENVSPSRATPVEWNNILQLLFNWLSRENFLQVTPIIKCTGTRNLI